MAEPRVLIVISSADRRGAELEGIELTAELSARGTTASVVALAPSATGVAADAEIIGDRPLSIGTIRELRRRARSVDVVVAYGSSSLPACAIALLGSGVPFVYRSIGDPGRWVRGRLHRLRTALLFHRARHVVALWPEAALSIVRLYRVLERRVTVIPNARSSDRFRPASATERSDARAALGVSSAERVVVFVGALSEEKRPLLAIEAVMAVDGLLLLVAGDGPLRPSVQQAAARSGGRVRCLGSVADVTKVLHAADVLVSTSRTEGMPGSLIEAALCAVPVVATDVGAVGQVLDRAPSLLLPADASPSVIGAALVEALEMIVEGPIDRSFTWEVVVPAWQTLLRTTAGS